ncbi:MAG: FtsX-like permease family protein [Candidatus Cloacimonetes bacterium]|nr:FtsX-like permease family protein [Candidatus Cloacimonadota bacterium]
MFSFILKGILRDRSRALFPIITVVAGVFAFVFYLGFMDGYVDSIIRQNARFSTGHLKIVTNAYAQEIDQKPYDLGFLEIRDELVLWRKDYPAFDWLARINFGALLDVPDSSGNTSGQGDALVFAIDLLAENKDLEYDAMNLKKALLKGSLPQTAGEILLSDLSFTKLGLELGQSASLISSTIDGAMAIRNYRICGTVVFNTEMLDRGGVIIDLADAQELLNMPDGASEIFGISRNGKYDKKLFRQVKADFNMRHGGNDEFDPVMLTIEDQYSLGTMLAFMDYMLWVMNFAFMFLLGIILWNAGLMNGIRRYGETGVRLAIGEEKRHLYLSQLYEAIMIGVLGSIIGALAGLGMNWIFNHFGMNMTSYNRSSSIMSENIIYTAIDLKSCLLGMIPGIFAPLIGSALAGLVIFKRQTSQLFKELET